MRPESLPGFTQLPEAAEAERLRKSRREAVKEAAFWAWYGITIASMGTAGFIAEREWRGVAIGTTERAIQYVGITMFLASILYPGVEMARDVTKGIVDKWQGKS